jgi:cyclic pyranopterin phosphate synthase
VASLPGVETLGMTTNGILLCEKAAALRAAGLSAGSLNVSLDTRRPERFAQITGEDRLAEVMAGIEASLAAGFAPVKVNVVVMAGANADELCDFVELARERPLHVRFIEYMPFKDNGWEGAAVMPYHAMVEEIRRSYELIPRLGRARRVAKEYTIPGFAGAVGFITALSEDFCRECNRVRLTADGAMKTCLFDGPEVSLRDLMRSGADDAALAGAIRGAVFRKPAGHPPAEELRAVNDRAMIEIGG